MMTPAVCRRLPVALGLALALAACSSQPPAPDWTLAARDGTERGNLAHLEGQARVANLEWQRARQAAARTGDAVPMARVALAQCAARVASLEPTPLEPCVRAQALLATASTAAPTGSTDSAPAALRAYSRYLGGEVLEAEDMARLPVAHQAPARLRQAVQAGGETPGPALDARWAQALQGMADPLSRLVAAAVAWRSGQAGPAVMAAATATASAQGWRRPLLAWLGLHALWAEQVGQADLARQLRQRMDWVMEAGPVNPAAVSPAARSARPPAQTAD